MVKSQLLDTYYIYDSRYKINPDEALELDVCDTLHEARKSFHNNGSNIIVRLMQKYLGDDKYETLSKTIVQ